MKLLIRLLFFVLAIQKLSAQQSFISLYEKKKFEKLDEKLNREFIDISKGKMDVIDPRLFYCKSLLFNEKEYTIFNTDSAYTYLIQAKNFLSNVVDLKLKNDLAENAFDLTVLNKHLNSICLNALERLKSINSEESYNQYLTFYKDGDQDVKNTITSLRNKVSFEKASKINSIESYQNFVDKYPDAIERQEALKNRNNLAFLEASSINSIESYQNFIDKYSDADEKQEAVRKRNTLAYDEANSINTIIAYKHFINKYPNAIEVNSAWEKIYKIDFEESKINNTAQAFYNHMKEYPNSPYKNDAKILSQDCEYKETIISGNYDSYKTFISRFGKENKYKSLVLDTLCSYYSKILDFKGLEFCVDNSDGQQRDNFLLVYHDLYTKDGEWTTLNKFYSKYNSNSLNSIKKKDYEIAELGKSINLSSGYFDYLYEQYDEYIKIAAPKDRAFVALQRMIKSDIDSKNYPNALSKVNKYASFFNSDKNFLSLVEMLTKPIDKSIVIKNIEEINNSLNGRQYSPKLSADEKTIYFCAKDRDENIGGEDIFVSYILQNKSWSSPSLVTELSTSNGHEAPEHISADNTTFYYFRNGTLNQGEFTSSGIGANTKELSKSINQGGWQADICVSSDGNAMLFSSIYNKNLNYNEKSSTQMIGELSDYHGAAGHQSDIYVSLKDNDGNWGKAINLGPTINTIHCDRSAFLHPDMKTLYFSSDGHGGFGNVDVFVSKRLADSCWNCWSEPINLGKEINSTSADWGYNINTEGDKAYFSRDSKIAYLTLPKHLRPNYVATVNGTVTDDNGQIVACSIIWEDLETGKIIGTSKSNPKDGSYYMVLPLGKNYGYYIEKEGYFPVSNNVDVKSANKAISITEDILLVSFKQMVEKSTPVRLNNLFFNSGKSELLPSSIPELKRVAEIIKKEKIKVEISGHTDDVGETKMNEELSNARANSVKTFLLSQGVTENLLISIGYGESRPVMPNNSDAGRAKNRRVELRFVK